jgi:hypothetical protein
LGRRDDRCELGAEPRFLVGDLRAAILGREISRLGKNAINLDDELVRC